MLTISLLHQGLEYIQKLLEMQLRSLIFQNRLNDKHSIIKIISGLIIVIFFTLYTHSGFVSGGKLFESAFGLNYHLGLISVAIIVILYTFFGGYLAVSITDFSKGLSCLSQW